MGVLSHVMPGRGGGEVAGDPETEGISGGILSMSDHHRATCLSVLPPEGLPYPH